MLEHSSIELSIALMAYKEEENLRQLLPRMIRSLEHFQHSYEILVIDTIEPMDQTKSLCEEFDQVVYYRREKSNRYGDALRTAIEKAQGTFLLIMDSDGSHTPEFIPNMLEDRNQYDLVVASRYMREGQSENNVLLVFMSKIVNLCYASFLRLPCRDVSNSFRLYRTKLIKTLHLKCQHFDIMEEILHQLVCRYKDLRIREIPYHFQSESLEAPGGHFLFLYTRIFARYFDYYVPLRGRVLRSRDDRR